MASRRMFSLRIINSARFLKMPISSQALYFHLGLHADDDGIVEAYPVLTTVGCSEDDLKVLVSKGFVQVLNEDLVTFITDWKENNVIRADRKVDSIYQDLLLSMIPTVEILEKKQRADVRKKIVDSPRTDNGQSMDGIGKDRLGKDRLGEVRSGKDSIDILSDESDSERIVNESCNESHHESSKPTMSDVQEVVNAYNLYCPSLPECKKLTDKRIKAIKARLKTYSLEDFEEVFKSAEQSDFLSGRSGKWKCSFDWLINESNMVKVLEGNYNNKKQDNLKSAIDSFAEWAKGEQYG